MTPRDLANFARTINGVTTRINRKGKGYEVRAFVPMIRRDEFRAAAKEAGIRLLWHGPINSTTLSVTIGK
jgi:hypothetical protein